MKSYRRLPIYTLALLLATWLAPFDTTNPAKPVFTGSSQGRSTGRARPENGIILEKGPGAGREIHGPVL